jgi:hypothetical protein
MKLTKYHLIRIEQIDMEKVDHYQQSDGREFYIIHGHGMFKCVRLCWENEDVWGAKCGNKTNMWIKTDPDNPPGPYCQNCLTRWCAETKAFVA